MTISSNLRLLCLFMSCYVVFVVCLSANKKSDHPNSVIQLLEVDNLSVNSLPNQTKDTKISSRTLKRVHKRFFKEFKLFSATKNQSITCPELHNYTFTNQPPYDVLGIPECGEQVQPMMVLYLVPLNSTKTRQQSLNDEQLFPDSDNSTNEPSRVEKEPTVNDLDSFVFVLKEDNDTFNFQALNPAYETSGQDISNSDDTLKTDSSTRKNYNSTEANPSIKVDSTKHEYLSNIEYGQTLEELESNLKLEDGFLQCSLIPENLPNTITESCVAILNARTDINKLVILIHGYLNSFPTYWLHEMQASIQKLEPGTAILIYGWGHGLGDIWTFWRAARNSRYAGRALYEMIKYIQENVNHPIYIHCAGHSLGAHVCGFAGKALIDLKDPKIRKFDRISGMDPAGPLFANDVPFPFNNLNVDPSARLGPHDADYVDVIHTDGNARYLDYIPQYGTLETLGSVDFYPGRDNHYYGCYQPGCGDVIDVISCSHSRSHQLYAASIDQTTCLASRVCDGDPHALPAGCKFLNNTPPLKTIAMGYWLNQEDKPFGKYTIEVSGIPPFCL